MRLAADMPKLEKNEAALGMNGIRDTPPAGDLSIGIDARRHGVAISLAGNRRCLRDDETSLRGALLVIAHHQAAWDVANLGPHAGQRGHHHAVGNGIRADLNEREQF